MGTSTISTGPFSSSQTVNVYQRLSPLNQFWECEALGSEGRTAGQLPSRLWAWQSLTKQNEYGAVLCFEYVQMNVKFWSLPSGYD